MSTPQNAPHHPSPFLALPFELRLDVYTWCSPVSILTLTHTCTSLYIEINTRKSLVRSSSNQNFWNSLPSIYMEANADHPILSGRGRRVIPLTIFLIANLRVDDTDAALFNSLYGSKSEELVGIAKGWWCCDLCFEIKTLDEFLSPWGLRCGKQWCLERCRVCVGKEVGTAL
ncbi:hypothetical protein BJ508DRAFT_333547 [Ascobolus immersus RN42]|uniref:F-box domain-containing protein n=1 Tax=Ascobolus immersus RN42 TaxID=1160509 RepID=A0A3N4HQA5_ASCIM|nr:hypothetical protein BJ508DRAFT_333547 [Ascobolus immersus RN42]